MTNLTPEAVKAALGKLAIPQGKFIACDCEDDNCFHDRHNSAMNDLHFYAPDLAREYLRLKEVEKAAETLADQCDYAFYGVNASGPRDFYLALAALRVAVEGK